MSKKVIFSTYGPNGGSLAQISSAPDGKIYAICWGDTTDTTNLSLPNRYYLSMIENPNQSYPACNFIPRGLWLNGRLASSGIPDFIDYDLGPVDGSMCDTLGIDAAVVPYDSENSVNVFPNPTTGKINISMIEQKVSLFNLLGEQVDLLYSDQNGDIILPNKIPDGIYVIQFIFDDAPVRKQYRKIQLIRN